MWALSRVNIYFLPAPLSRVVKVHFCSISSFCVCAWKRLVRSSSIDGYIVYSRLRRSIFFFFHETWYCILFVLLLFVNFLFLRITDRDYLYRIAIYCPLCFYFFFYFNWMFRSLSRRLEKELKDFNWIRYCSEKERNEIWNCFLFSLFPIVAYDVAQNRGREKESFIRITKVAFIYGA